MSQRQVRVNLLMKKFILLYIAVCVLIFLVGCGDSNPNVQQTAIAYVHVTSSGTPASTLYFEMRQESHNLRARAVLPRAGSTTFSINTMNVDGTNQKTIITTNEYIYGVSLSKDAKKIAYVKWDSTSNANQIYLLDVASKESTRLTTTSDNKSDAMFVPNGSAVIYRAYTSTVGEYLYAQLWSVPVAGGTPTAIATSPNICIHEPHVSLDGTMVLFDYHQLDVSSALGSVNINGTGYKSIVTTGANFYTPAFSTDKSRIYYADWTSIPKLTMSNADGSNAKALLTTGASLDPYPVGNKVLFIWDTTANYTEIDIYSMDPDGTNQKKLTNGGFNYMHYPLFD